MTVIKKRGRGKHPRPEIHASKGSAVFRTQFTTKYVIELITTEQRKPKAVEIIRKHAKKGKICLPGYRSKRYRYRRDQF